MSLGSPVDEIKTKLNIVDVIQEYIQLKRAGTSFRAICPFHSEKTPSFFVSPDRQIWHCFGCGEGGDLFTFVMRIEGMEFPEALRVLAKKANVQLRSYNPELTNQKTKLQDLLRDAASFYRDQLFTATGQNARAYLKRRGLTDETIELFSLGFAPDAWSNLAEHLGKKGYSENDIFLAGLTIKKERGVGFYDRFRNRIMFPIRDVHGNTIGFGGRALAEGKDVAKYINSPQTLLYNKSDVVFGLDRAKHEIRTQKNAVVVEGYMDVIASHQAGVTNVVSTSGTALTTGHVRLLRRYTDTILFAFDTDVAGEEASRRGLDVALSQEMNVRMIDLPAGKDPDECIRQNPNDWKNALEKAKPVMEYFFEKTLRKYSTKTVDGKKQVAKSLLPLIAKIADSIEQSHYVQQLARTINVQENALWDKIKKMRQPQTVSSPKEAPPQSRPHDRFVLLTEDLVGIGLAVPDHLNYIIDQLSPTTISNEKTQDLYKKLIFYYTQKHDFDFALFIEELRREAKELAEYADILYFRAQQSFTPLDEEAVRVTIREGVKDLKRHAIHAQLHEMQERIRTAEHDGDRQRAGEYSAQLNSLLGQLRDVQS